jgi:hypothetical protein
VKNLAQTAALVLAAALLLGGLARLFHWRVERGDVFPKYSSLRSDETGVRALRESLASVPGIRVSFRTAQLSPESIAAPSTVLLLGVTGEGLESLTPSTVDALDSIARGGSRVVIGFAPDQAPDPGESDGAALTVTAPAPRRRGRAVSAGLALVRYRWNFALAEAAEEEGSAAAKASRTPWAPKSLPDSVPWNGNITFAPAAGWAIDYSVGGRPVVIERALGSGSIVALADSYLLTNAALMKDRQTRLLSWVIGANTSVVFDETHLGVVSQPGAMALARRYGLSGAAACLLVVAVLYFWQQTAPFVPPEEEVRDILLSYHPAAGLEALLRRSVPPDQLTQTCIAEWRQGGRREDLLRVQAAASRASDPVAAYNAATRALRRRQPRPLSP